MNIREKKICKTSNRLETNKFTKEEEVERYNSDLDFIFYNTREVLDNLDTYREYRVSWKCYSSKSPTLPYIISEKEKDL